MFGRIDPALAASMKRLAASTLPKYAEIVLTARDKVFL